MIIDKPTFSLGMSSMKGAGISDDTMSSCSTSMFNDSYQAELQELNASLDSLHVDERPKKDPIVIEVQGRTPVEFLAEDPQFQKTLSEGGSNPSAAVDRWAVNRLTRFREFRGWDTTVAFEDLSLAECASILIKFFEQICKKDGSLYPTQTLMGLYRAFHRVLRRRQEVRIVQTGKDEPIFHMRESPLFKQVGIACVLAMERSRSNGANLPRKKASVISLADEATILSHSCTGTVHPRGLQRRAVYFLLFRFAIRGGDELHRLAKTDFELGCNENGPFVRYDERLSKNYKVGLGRYQDEHFRPAVTSYDTSMVETIESLISHLPVAGIFLFYHCIDSPRTHAWYSTQRVSVKKLSGILKEIHRECGLVTDGVTNKSGRTTCVTRMATEGVPAEVGMIITGHKSQGAYARYDRSTESKVIAAQKCASGSSSFEAKFHEETERFKQKVVNGDDDGSPNKRKKGDEDMAPAVGYIPPAVGLGVQETPAMIESPTTTEATTALNEMVPMVIELTPMIESELSCEVSADGKVDWRDDGWVDEYNWDEHFENLQPSSVVVNPVQALFTKVQSITNCTISISIGKLGN